MSCGLRQILCFFFQAEDGIRDTSVTGVQTCALPISQPRPVIRRDGPVLRAADAQRLGPHAQSVRARRDDLSAFQIGRASCRERVLISVGAEKFQKKGAASRQSTPTMN